MPLYRSFRWCPAYGIFSLVELLSPLTGHLNVNTRQSFSYYRSHVSIVHCSIYRFFIKLGIARDGKE
jgi:hypothetical protein